MRPEEIRELTDEQIERRIRELREETFRLRFRSATMQLENPNIIETIRRDIARMKTILRERELERESRADEAEAPTAETDSPEFITTD
jgi:large subunit ribosomal protein L29